MHKTQIERAIARREGCCSSSAHLKPTRVANRRNAAVKSEVRQRAEHKLGVVAVMLPDLCSLAHIFGAELNDTMNKARILACRE